MQTDTIDRQEDTNVSMCDIHNVESAQRNDGLDVVYDNMDTLISVLVRIYFITY